MQSKRIILPRDMTKVPSDGSDRSYVDGSRDSTFGNRDVLAIASGTGKHALVAISRRMRR
jgi:hypothetical protein